MSNYKIKDGKIEVTEDPVIGTLSITEVEERIKMLEKRVLYLNKEIEKTNEEKGGLETILETYKQSEAK